MELNRLQKLVNTGKIFGVKFIKRDGSVRTMSCRTGVKRFANGGNLGYNRDEKNILGVYEMPNKGYKSIRADSIISLKAGGQTYED